MKSIKNKIFKIIQPADNSSILSKMFDLVIVTLILINTVTIIAATFSLSCIKNPYILNYRDCFRYNFLYWIHIKALDCRFIISGKETVHCTHKIVLFSDGYCRFISNTAILHTVSITHWFKNFAVNKITSPFQTFQNEPIYIGIIFNR